MKIGFTGTRHKVKISEEQIRQFKWLLADLPGGEFHHGDCIGADAMAGEIAKKQHKRWREIVHPPDKDNWRAHRKGDKVLEPKSYKTRDRDIVNDTEVLIAMPSSRIEKFIGSGTWYTIRYARQQGKEIWILFPDGGLKYEDHRKV
jgi:hypothetical protein